MATKRQIVSNRKNAAKSTGPKTEEGKIIARRNALRHGLSAQVVLPEECTEMLEARIVGFKIALDLTNGNALQEFQIRDAALASLKLEICAFEEFDRRVEISQVADSDTDEWDDERWEEVLAIAATLKRNPARGLAKLRKTPAGRRWLIEQWQHLYKYADSEKTRLSFGKEEYNLALDLLGKPPRNLDQQPELRYQVFERADRKEFILAKIAELQRLCADDEMKNEFHRQQHRRGLEIETDARLKQLRRYESANRRVYNTSLAALEEANGRSKRSQSLAASTQARPETKTEAHTAPVANPGCDSISEYAQSTDCTGSEIKVQTQVSRTQAPEIPAVVQVAAIKPRADSQSQDAQPRPQTIVSQQPAAKPQQSSPQLKKNRYTQPSLSAGVVFEGNRRSRKAQEANYRRAMSKGGLKPQNA